MENGLNQQKLEMWKKKLIELEKAHKEAMRKKGEAAAMGDLSENAAYQMAVDEADTYSARIVEVKKIIKKLENG